MSTVNTEKMEAIADLSAKRVRELICENEGEIIEAITAVTQKAQDKDDESGGESTVKINLTHTITLNLTKDEQIDKLAWSVRHTSEIAGSMPDPDQPELPVGE